MRGSSSLLLAAAALSSIIGCELVLGLEEHTLGPVDDGEGGAPEGGMSGISGTTAATGGGGTGGKGGTSGSSSGGMTAGGAGGEAGAGGSTVDAGGAAGAGGTGAPCPLCEAETALVHRYSFDGTGIAVIDGVGTADGEVIGGAMLAGTGTLALAGTTSGEYVALPPGIISALTETTIEAWVLWNGGEQWQRIFDFGSNIGTMSETSVFVTPAATSATGPMQASFKVVGQAERLVNSLMTMPASVQVQVALVIEGIRMTLYLDGAEQASTSPVGALADINDVNVWLGKSNWSGDDNFGGAYDDVRIYNAALGPEVIAALHAAGADHQF